MTPSRPPTAPPLPEIGLFIEVLIKLLESGLTAFSIHTNVIKITVPQNGGHFERRAAIRQRNTIRRLTATSQYHAHSKQVPACVSGIV